MAFYLKKTDDPDYAKKYREAHAEKLREYNKMYKFKTRGTDYHLMELVEKVLSGSSRPRCFPTENVFKAMSLKDQNEVIIAGIKEKIMDIRNYLMSPVQISSEELSHINEDLEMWIQLCSVLMVAGTMIK